MTSVEMEEFAIAVIPYIIALALGIIVTMIIIRPKKQTVPVVCPLPSQVILDELKVLLTDAFEKAADKVSFLKEAEKLYDTRTALTRKF